MTMTPIAEHSDSNTRKGSSKKDTTPHKPKLPGRGTRLPPLNRSDMVKTLVMLVLYRISVTNNPNNSYNIWDLV